jgi:hypothetical protein
MSLIRVLLGGSRRNPRAHQFRESLVPTPERVAYRRRRRAPHITWAMRVQAQAQRTRRARVPYPLCDDLRQRLCGQ